MKFKFLKILKGFKKASWNSIDLKVEISQDPNEKKKKRIRRKPLLKTNKRIYTKANEDKKTNKGRVRRKRTSKGNSFKDRFKNARPLEKPTGWNLPLGSIHRKNHGDGFMLLGDAAGLVDPFTGEGIGNAMFSAKFAMQIAKKAITVAEPVLSEVYEIVGFQR